MYDKCVCYVDILGIQTDLCARCMYQVYVLGVCDRYACYVCMMSVCARCVIGLYDECKC